MGSKLMFSIFPQTRPFISSHNKVIDKFLPSIPV